MLSASGPLGVWMNSSQALSRASNSRFIRENLLQNRVSLGLGHRVVEALPRLLKLEQLAGDFWAEMAPRIFWIFDHAVQLQSGAEQPFAFDLVFGEFFWGGLLLDDLPILALEVIVDGFNPG